jgi:hypothetical protein
MIDDGDCAAIGGIKIGIQVALQIVHEAEWTPFQTHC